MGKFDKLLNEAIEKDAAGYYSMATDVLRQLEDMQRSMEDLNTRIRHLTEQIMSNLGTEIRKRHPKLDVNLSNGRCNVGYRSRTMSCAPDLGKRTWSIGGSPFARKFCKMHNYLLPLEDDVVPLAHAIADYFTKNYKSLGEENIGRPITKSRDSSGRGAGHYY